MFSKSDNGPGRTYCKLFRAMFRRDMHREGFYIEPSLPNVTSTKIIENMTKEEEAKVPPANLANDNILEIINGKKDDPPDSSHPFNGNFIPEEIFKSYLTQLASPRSFALL